MHADLQADPDSSMHPYTSGSWFRMEQSQPTIYAGKRVAIHMASAGYLHADILPESRTVDVTNCMEAYWGKLLEMPWLFWLL